MGHLGQSTPITTVQDKEIVLTASDGHTFKMKIADLAEAVRQVMPVATNNTNGLINSQLFNSIPFCGILAHKQLFLLSKGGIWERQLVTIAISHSGSEENSFVVLSADIYENSKVRFKTNITGIFPSSAKLLYRIDNGILGLYLYGEVNIGSFLGLIIQSQKMRPQYMGEIADIADYTVIL